MSAPNYTSHPSDPKCPRVDRARPGFALGLESAADELWRRLDPELRSLTHNPWVILQTVSQSKLEMISSDPDIRSKIDALLDAGEKSDQTPSWFEKAHPHIPLKTVAYFSMECMRTEALSIYSGGLGNELSLRLTRPVHAGFDRFPSEMMRLLPFLCGTDAAHTIRRNDGAGP